MAEEKKGDVAELIARTWRLINYIDERLDDSTVDEADKIRWAGVLANAIGTLNKLFYKAGVGKLDKDDMAIVLSKIPGKYSKIMMKRMRIIERPGIRSRRRL
ncbi:MAG: hypothetical protein AOA66_1309 [Candidatus Bathyarchaeota archaeon BA2]|nr:MAG: hypothetical protein AOA66_1309 [Candidatus Bathyarchaeota archaeon BA2]